MTDEMKKNIGRKSVGGGEILIIDDTPFNRNLLAEILADSGFRVRTAADGESGLRAVAESPPELVLLDIRMPGMNGFEVCARLKENPLTWDIPVIFISALGDADAKVRAFDAGGIDYVTMPFEKKEVLARVGSHIDLHRMRRRLEELVNQRTIELAEKAEKLQEEIDIRKRTESELLQGKRYLEGLINSLPGVFYHLSEEGKFLNWNRNLETVLDCGDENLGGAGMDEFVSERGRAGYREMQNRILDRGYAEGEIDLGPRGGASLPFFLTGSHMTIAGMRTIIGAGFDIADRKAAEKALVESETLLREAQKIAHIGHWKLDLSDNELAWSDEMHRIFEVDGETFAGSYEAFLDMVHPEDRDYVHKEYTDSFKNGTRCDIVHRLLLPGGGIKYVHQKFGTEYDAGGKPIRTMGTVQDVTVLKNAEIQRERMESQLRQSQKMEAIGVLAGGVAHDFNNILHAILGYAEMIEQFDPPEDKETRGFLSQIIGGAVRAGDLVDRILTFSRQTEKEKLPISIESVVDAALKFIRASLPSTIRIETNIAGIDGSVLADPTQMHQVIMNFCTNAAHAMEGNGGVLKVGLEPVELGAEAPGRLQGLSPGTYARLSVSDTGRGVPREIVDRIFEPYFTTKKSGEGTGLGLSVVHGIVKEHNGAVTVESVEGEGSEFIVYLPVLAVKAAPIETDVSEPLETGTGRVLLVDDEKPLAEYGQTLLSKLGYEVVAETDSLKALEIYRANPAGFDLVITDMTMPDLTGLALTRELTRVRPDLPVILCTGCSRGASPEEIKASGASALLSKPLSLRELTDLVNRYILPGSPGHDS